jgi:hypothetical protein
MPEVGVTPGFTSGTVRLSQVTLAQIRFTKVALILIPLL